MHDAVRAQLQLKLTPAPAPPGDRDRLLRGPLAAAASEVRLAAKLVQKATQLAQNNASRKEVCGNV